MPPSPAKTNCFTMRNQALYNSALANNRRGAEGIFAVDLAVQQEFQLHSLKQLSVSVPRKAAVDAEASEPFGRRCSSSLSGARRASMTPAFLCALPRSGALQFMAEQKQKALLCNSAYACQAASITDQPPNFSVTSVPSVFNQTGKRSAANPPITHPFA